MPGKKYFESINCVIRDELEALISILSEHTFLKMNSTTVKFKEKKRLL